MVATVIKESLLQFNIFKNSKLHGNELVSRNNINNNELRELILKVAKEWNIPFNNKKNNINPFIIKPDSGNDDFNIFEFGTLKESKKPLIFKNNQIICCVGDSAYAPFWPKGTGVNHGFLGVYILVEYFQKWFQFVNSNNSNNNNENETESFKNDIETKCYKDFHELSKDLKDKIWHKERFAQYLNDYDVSDFYGNQAKKITKL